METLVVEELQDVNLVGVYGSLKRGYGNHPVMEEANGIFVGKALTQDKFIMDGYGYPFIVRPNSEQDSMSARVVLELYKVPKAGVLRELDSLEGHPSFYRREEIPVILENGDKTSAWVYIYQDNIFHDENLINKEGHYEW